MLRHALGICACLPLVGCAVFGPSGSGPEGMTRYDTDLRSLARSGDFDRALELTEEGEGGAGDDLLRVLHRAAVLRYAGEYAESNRLLQEAELEIDDRYTRSVSRAAASLLTNDRVLAYRPPRVERLMIHYVGALNYISLGDPAEAAVEARRLATLLDGSEDMEFDPRELRLRRVLRYFTGAVFEAAGEWNDADVAYRNAWIGWDETAPPIDPDTLAQGAELARALASITPARLDRDVPAGRDSAEIVLVLETGFIVHRVERAVAVPIYRRDRDAFDSGDDDEKYDAGLCVAARTLGPSYVGPRSSSCHEPSGSSLFVVTAAWPALQRTDDRVVGGRLTVRGSTDRELPAVTAPPAETALAGAAAVGATTAAGALGGVWTDSASLRLTLDLSAAYAAEFDERLGGVVAKAVARAAAKYVVVDAARKAAKKEDEALGDVVGLVGNLAAIASEHADLRSWHLLPGAVRIARIRVPAGRAELTLVLDQAGRTSGRTIPLGSVALDRGQIAIVAARVWP